MAAGGPLSPAPGGAIRCSIGIAPSDFFAKTSTDMEKPNGLVVIERADLRYALHGLKLRHPYGIEASMQARPNADGKGADGEVASDGKTYTWHRWAGILSPRPGTEVLATYANHYYAGKAAATTRKLDKGTVTMIGVSTDDGRLERALVRSVYQRAGVAIEDLPTGVFHEWRGGNDFIVSYRPGPFAFPLPPNTRVVLRKTPLAPAGVLIWKDTAKQPPAR